ncbi:MAG: flavin reductase [Dehalococcoidia bacterium]|nr:flavin reductase [Dehalococcoidia bacterium]
MGRKVAFDPDLNTWQPSVLPGQVVVVSTVNAAGEPNIAPKSGVIVAAAAGGVIAFRCNVEHTTYRNIAAQGEFVVNIPGEPLAERVWSLSETHGGERLKQAGLTLIPAQVVAAPIVEECRAHLECRLDDSKQFGSEVVVFGKVVSASIDGDCLEGTAPERYFGLRPVFSLEKGVYGTLDGAKWIGTERSTNHSLFVVRVGDRPGGRDEEVIRGHFAFLRSLRAKGVLLLGGPFAGGPGGMYILTAASVDQAEELALQDPLVRAGGPHTTKAWLRTF